MIKLRGLVKVVIVAVVLCNVVHNSVAQDGAKSHNVYHLTMDKALELAQLNSIASQEHNNTFSSQYWNFRAYKASLLPALNLSSQLGNLNRSLVQLQDATSGEIYYQASQYMTNSLQLSVDQVISATGGRLSLYSSLERLDQFGDKNLTSWYSQPVSLSYLQPFFAYNPYKWSKKIEPLNYERAKKQYLENMELVTSYATVKYWSYAKEQQQYDIAVKNFNESKELYRISGEKFRLGTVKKSDLLQLELKVLNDSLALNNNEISLISVRNNLTSFIGLKQDTEVKADISFDLPKLELTYLQVLSDALRNSSFTVDQQIQMIEAERTIAQAKGDRGVNVQLTARFGLSNTDETLPLVYQHLRDQEVVGLSVSLPIYDWGLGKGKVQMAKAQAKTLENQLEQQMIDYKQDIFVKVMQFNNQAGQCLIAQKAAEIAELSYSLAMENFLAGSKTVTDLNSARAEYDNAQNAYVQSIGDYWQYYYEIRQLTLHDYMLEIDISAEYDKVINNL